MKRLLLVAFTILSINTIAQTNTFPTSGNVGIGTTMPQQILTIDTKQSASNAGVPALNGDVQNGILRLQVNGNSWGEALDFGMNVLPSYAWIQATNRGNLGVNYNLALNPNGGNIGIGTTNPSAKLDVNNYIRISPFTDGASGIGYLNTGSELRLLNGNIYNPENNYGAKILFGGMYNPSGSTPGDAIYNSILWAAGQLKIRNNQQDKIVIGGGDEWGQQNVLINPQGGNVGIGTTTLPQQLSLTGGIGFANQNAIDKKLYSPQDGTLEWLTHDNAGEHGFAVSHQGERRVYLNTKGNSYLIGGNVGIGTTNPDEKLTVNGVIHAKEVKVDLSGPLADFVFKSNYKLMSLPQVEQFVKANNHLPQMPSAEEVAKNGLSMGEMQNKLLQKVEELTLYAIQQNNKIQDQEIDRKTLEKKYNALLEKVEILTRKIDKE
jgi:hypothetical protein